MDAIRAVLNQALNILTTIQISDVLDILIVGYLIYKAISLIRRTNSNNLAKGLLLLFGVFLLSELSPDRIHHSVRSTMDRRKGIFRR